LPFKLSAVFPLSLPHDTFLFCARPVFDITSRYSRLLVLSRWRLHMLLSVQAASRRLLTADTRALSEVCPCGMLVGKSVNNKVARSVPCTLGSHCQLSHPCSRLVIILVQVPLPLWSLAQLSRTLDLCAKLDPEGLQNKSVLSVQK
jgi:hypothetical protein